jgi:hypothetical protein
MMKKQRLRPLEEKSSEIKNATARKPSDCIFGGSLKK